MGETNSRKICIINNLRGIIIMRYLFFDLEYATSKGGVSKICEFGYVITNEKFEVISKNNLIINPNISKSEWDYRVVRKILTRRISEYEKNSIFSFYYDEIKKMILSCDYVIGHTLDSDASALNDECKRYGLKSIDFDFYDVKEFYKEYKNTSKSIGVANILKELEIEGETLQHDAFADAYNTMLEMKAMLEKLEMSLGELIELCPSAKDRTENFLIRSIEENWAQRKREFISTLSGDGTNDLEKSHLNKKKYSQFLENVMPQGIVGNKLKDKIISVSLNYENHHYCQILNLIQIIVNEGGTVTNKTSLINTFISYDYFDEEGELKKDERFTRVLEANQNGSRIQIIRFADLLNILGITEEELNRMPMISFDFLFDENTYIKDKRDRNIVNRIVGRERLVNRVLPSGDEVVEGSSEKLSSTIGDRFGDILLKYCK